MTFHRHSKAGPVQDVWNSKYNTGAKALDLALIKKSKIFKSSSNSNSFCKLHYLEVRLLFSSDGRSEAFTTAGAATLQHFLAVLGCHACTEPVSLRSLLS